MPNTPVPAAAEGLPKINRRTFFQVAGSTGVVAGVVAVPEQEAARPKGFSPEQVEVLMEAAYLFGCLPPAQQVIALARLKETMRQRGELS